MSIQNGKDYSHTVEIELPTMNLGSNKVIFLIGLQFARVIEY